MLLGKGFPDQIFLLEGANGADGELAELSSGQLQQESCWGGKVTDAISAREHLCKNSPKMTLEHCTHTALLGKMKAGLFMFLRGFLHLQKL